MDDKLKTALAGLEKTYGKNTVISGDAVLEMDRLSTGALGLDIAVGGGYGKGRIVEIFGAESSGKTTLCIHAMIEAQKEELEKNEGKQVVFIDAEHSFDRNYATSIGLNVDELLISQPDNGEQALEIAEKLISTGKVSVCVIDSVAALTPKAEIEGDMGDSKMGLHARLMSQALRKLTAIVQKTNTILIFTNQMREKIGVMFGNPNTTTGGNALKFYASIRLEVSKQFGNKDSDGAVIDILTRVKVSKNKTAPPFKTCEFNILFGKGISRTGEVLKLGVDLNIINKSGSWYSYQGTKLGQGSTAVMALLEDNPEMYNEIEALIRKEVGL